MLRPGIATASIFTVKSVTFLILDLMLKSIKAFIAAAVSCTKYKEQEGLKSEKFKIVHASN